MKKKAAARPAPPRRPSPPKKKAAKELPRPLELRAGVVYQDGKPIGKIKSETPEPTFGEQATEGLKSFVNGETPAHESFYPVKTPDPEPVARGRNAYVRMLHPNGVVRPVPADFVEKRLTENYRFIDGEPSIPRSSGRPSLCDDPAVHKSPRPRTGANISNGNDAREYWAKVMLEDSFTYGNRTDLDLYFARNFRQIRAAQQSGYGQQVPIR